MIRMKVEEVAEKRGISMRNLLECRMFRLAPLNVYIMTIATPPHSTYPGENSPCVGCGCV